MSLSALSALSAQIKRLESKLGQPLFARVGRSLKIIEAGQLALGYADPKFAAGSALMALLRGRRRDERQVLRIGAIATLSRNFQGNVLWPLLARADVEFVLHSGNLTDLLPRRDNDIRAGFDMVCEQLGIRYQLRVEVGNMALSRLLACDSNSVALLPTVVVQDELRSGRLVEYAAVYEAGLPKLAM